MNSEQKDLSHILSGQFLEEAVYKPKPNKKRHSDKLKLVMGITLALLFLAATFIQPIQDNLFFAQLGIDREPVTFTVGLLLVLLAISGDYSIFDDIDSRR